MKLVTNRKLKKAIHRVVQIQILHARVTHCRQFDRALLPNSNLTMSDITHIFTDEKIESQRNVSNRSVSGYHLALQEVKSTFPASTPAFLTSQLLKRVLFLKVTSHVFYLNTCESINYAYTENNGTSTRNF